MLPILFQIGGITIYSYGAAMAVAFLIAIYVTRKISPEFGIDPDYITQLGIFAGIAGFIGTKILFAFTDWENFLADPWPYLALRKGLVWYGGPIAGILAITLIARRAKLNVLNVFDTCAPGTIIGHSIGRVGCFLAGCCHGRPTDSFLGVVFSGGLVDANVRGIPVYPTQLFEATTELLTFIYIYQLVGKRKFNGQLALSYIMIYAVCRGIIEFFRGDSNRGYVVTPLLSTSQFIAIGMFVIAAGAYYVLAKREAQKR